MVIYIGVVIGVVVLTSALIMIILSRIGMLSFRMVLAVALSSVLAGLLFPGIFDLLSGYMGGKTDAMTLFFVFLTTLVLYIMLTFILGIIISMVIPNSTFNAAATGAKGGRKTVDASKAQPQKAASGDDERTDPDHNYIEQIFSSLVEDKQNKSANIEDIPVNVENNLEKSVDSEKNIDKMGLGTFEQYDFQPDSDENHIESDAVIYEPTNGVVDDDGMKTAECLSVDDCVDEAFRLKEQGDLEGAILYYMYALDRKPDKDLVFWIVLDICVLYKTLGQIELARDILTSYADNYGDLMDSAIKEEIESNLLYIQE